MYQENTAAGVQVVQVVPILFIPKQCTTLEMNCDMSEDVFIELSITSPNTEGNGICIYSGYCNVKLIESSNTELCTTKTVKVDQENSSNSSISCEDQTPDVLPEANNVPTLSYNQSQVCIDPARSLYVHNNYDTTSQRTYSILENVESITLQQHNTCITQNVYSYDHQSHKKDLDTINLKKIPEACNQLDSPEFSYEDDESESEVLLSQLSKRNTNKEGDQSNLASIQGMNDALKQLMSTDIQSTSKQRKTILFLGEDSSSGQTIQNILYTDPMVICSTVIDVDHEVIVETSSPASKRKKIQCDKCKQIFDQISDFRQHMARKHTMDKVLKDNDLACSKCGKTFSNDLNYQMHNFGHGDPDLECPKCHKIYASKNTLKVHMKIHNRKFPCPYCFRSYATSESYKSHLKMHSKFDHIEDYYVDGYKDSDFYIDRTDGNDIHDNDEHSNDYHVTDENGDDDLGNNEHDDDHSNDVLSNKNNFKDDHGNDYKTGNHDKDEFGNGHLGKGNHSDDDNHIDFNKESSDPNIAQSYMDNLNEDFEHELINTEFELMTKMSGDLEDNDSELEINDIITVDGNDQGERAMRADSVIAKVMSNKIFLADKKVARTHASYNKTCQVCSKSFDRVGDLKRHLIEHVIKCTLAKTVSNNEGTLHISCEICQLESFNTIERYKTHLREHAKLTIYKCTFCDKSFSDSSNFSKHKKVHGISNFHCDLCHRRFNSKVMIERHIDLHAKNKPLKCKQCERYFHFESMLNKHVKSVHCKPGASRFPCRFCSEDFRSVKGKWDHEWFVHNIRNIIVDCLVCGAKFRKYSDLKKHCFDDHEMDIPTQKKLLKKNRSARFICT